MRNKQVIAGTLLNYAVLAFQTLSAIAITPFLISSLGDGTFGVYKIISSLIAYLGILNFGFGNAAIRFLTEIKVNQDIQKEKEFLSVIKMLNLLAATVAVALGIVLYKIIPQVFATSLTLDEIAIARQMFIVLIASVVVNIINDIYSAVIISNERFIFLKGLDLLRCTLRIALIFLIISMHPSAVVLVMIDLCMSIFAVVCNTIFCDRKLNTRPKYSFRVFKNLDKAYYKPVIIYATFFFFNLIVDQLLWNTNSIIIGIRLSSFDAAVYGSGATISAGFYTLTLVIGNLMFPRVVRRVSSGNSSKELTDIMISIARAQMLVALFLLTFYFACGRQFIDIWLGNSYQEAWTSSIIIMIGAIFHCLISAGHLILRAKNRQAFILTAYFIIFAINAIVTYLVVTKYGIVGAAFVTMVSFAIGVFLLITPYLHRTIGLDMLAFTKKLLPLFGIAAILGVACYFLFHYIYLDSWGKLIIAALVYAIVFYTIMYLSVMNKNEKEIVQSIIERVTGKIRRKSR